MKTPWDRPPSLRDAIDVVGETPDYHLIGSGHRAFGDMIFGSAIEPDVENLRGRSVLIASADPFLVATMMVELDGLAQRMTLYPAGLTFEHLPYVIRYAEIDAVVADGSLLGIDAFDSSKVRSFICHPRLNSCVCNNRKRLRTEWILLSSGTTGTPKMVLHTLASLAGAIRSREPNTDVIWSTFYDICRYGGLQIYLRAVLTRSTLLLAKPREMVADFLQRAGEAGVTHISGTPSHWRRVLMSPEANHIKPRYIRLSGEIADQAILNSLRSCYPDAEIIHAFASTEAGVAFEVRDALSGFPASMLRGTSGVDMKIVDSTLRVRSGRTAERYLGESLPVLKDPEGFVDTGDVLELRDGRYHFHGRRDGMINVGGLKVHPEEVETVLNRHPEVRLSLVRTKKSPITGELVVADVLLKDQSVPEGERARALEQIINNFCRASLPPHKVPAAIRFVAAFINLGNRGNWCVAMGNVIVTGGSRGIGLGIVCCLAKAGYHVMVLARKESPDLREAMDKATNSGSGSIGFAAYDLADTSGMPALVKQLRKDLGPVYALVNNAGMSIDGTLALTSAAKIEQVVQLNVVSPILLSKHVLRSMMAEGAGGRIVNLASIIAFTGYGGLSVYGATKASLIGFTRSLAREVGRTGVTVNAVAPGFVDTEMTNRLSVEHREQIVRRSALRRLVEVDDVAAAVEYLLSDGARNITGTVITVDAGNTA